MGASIAKSNTEIVNESIISAVVKSSQSTTNYLKSTQSMDLSGFNFGISQKQDLSTSIAALKQVQVDSNLIEDIAQNIKNEAEAEGVLLNPAYSESDVSIKNVISANFTTELLQSCVSAVETTQALSTRDGSINLFVSQKQTVEQLSKCKSLNEVSNQVSKELLQVTKSKATTESSWFGGYTITIGVIFIILIIILSIISIMSKKKKGKRGKKGKGRKGRKGKQRRERDDVDDYDDYSPQYYPPPPSQYYPPPPQYYPPPPPPPQYYQR